MGILVFWKNHRASAARWWAIMCLFVAAWAFWNTFSLLSATAEGSLKYLRIADAFALFVPVSFLHFAMRFSGSFHLRPLLLGYLATGLIAPTVGSPLFVTAGQKKFGIWFEVGGPTFAVFAFLFALLPAYGLWLIWQATRGADGARRAQLFCLFAASALGFGGGFTWFLPAFGIDIPPLGAHLISLYCIIVAYAIVRYRFLDIQVVIRRSLVYSLLVTLLTVGYFVLVNGMERLFQSTFGYRSVWVSLSAFALTALLFQPLKLWIQRWVDWLLFRMPQEELVKHVEHLEQQALLADKLKTISTLAAGMAHEIKNPLTALQTFAEFIPEKQSDPAFLKKLQEVMAAETRRIQGIVQELLDFAKPKPPQLKEVNPSSLIASTVDFLSGDLLKHHIRWALNCRHDGATIQADPDQLRQVLINLIQNAIEAMPNGGTLTVATNRLNDHLQIAVSDTGQGISRDLLTRIFDPFVTTKSRGTGLGLAMVQTILQSHRGIIYAASSPRGTTFTVRLPL